MFSIDADFGIHLSVVYATIFSLASSSSMLATEIAREVVHVSVRQDGALSPVSHHSKQPKMLMQQQYGKAQLLRVR